MLCRPHLPSSTCRPSSLLNANLPSQTTLKHAQKVAPAPEGEKGAALEGMNASGGAAGGTNHGTNVGQNKPPQEK